MVEIRNGNGNGISHIQSGKSSQMGQTAEKTKIQTVKDTEEKQPRQRNRHMQGPWGGACWICDVLVTVAVRKRHVRKSWVWGLSSEPVSARGRALA